MTSAGSFFFFLLRKKKFRQSIARPKYTMGWNSFFFFFFNYQFCLLAFSRDLINIWQMFNLETDDLAVEPYIPHMGMIIFDLWGCGGCSWPKASYLDAHFGTQHLVHPTAPVLLTKDSRNEMSYVWLSASISRILEPSLGLISIIS